MCKCSAMHATNSYVNNTNSLCRQSDVDTRSRDIDGLFVTIIFDSTKSELTRSTFTKYVDVELLCWATVNLWKDLLLLGNRSLLCGFDGCVRVPVSLYFFGLETCNEIGLFAG